MNAKKPMNTPHSFHLPLARRRFLESLAVASAGFTLPGFLAEALTLSPTVTQGPYYPLAHNIPLDKDNDLVQLDDHLTAATGLITYIHGRVLDSDGQPIRGALVELWHADHEGDYLYSTSASRNPACDPNFAGFGQYLTGSDGRYGFRTIKAGLYQGRTRHFHWGITLPGERTRTTTQTGWNEVTYDSNGSLWSTQNANDSVFRSVSNAEQLASLLLDFVPVEGTTTGEVTGSWDYVAGRTYTEPTYPNGGSLVVAGLPVAGPSGSGGRFKISVPAYLGYSYEVYANPTFADLGWRALPFALTETGTLDRHIHTATSEGTLDLYVAASAVKGFYYVSYRIPGANTGSP